MDTWQLHHARQQFGRVVDRAAGGSPQVITRRGTPVVVVLSMTDYRRLLVSKRSLAAFFAESPLAGSGVELSRDQA